MATPHVSGAAALILSVAPRLGPEAVKQVLLDTVDPIATAADRLVAGGRLNLHAALAAVQPRGDVSGNHAVGLEDAVLALQIAAGSLPDLPPGSPRAHQDVNGDGAIGTAEAAFVCRRLSRLF